LAPHGYHSCPYWLMDAQYSSNKIMPLYRWLWSQILLCRRCQSPFIYTQSLLQNLNWLGGKKILWIFN
jgi:hypothetical protein